jgi:hypothetical protein
MERLSRRIAPATCFITNWYKGFREQNLLKHHYNGVMARWGRCDRRERSARRVRA